MQRRGYYDDGKFAFLSCIPSNPEWHKDVQVVANFISLNIHWGRGEWHLPGKAFIMHAANNWHLSRIGTKNGYYNCGIMA
jgi:hypothetical protein